MIFITGDKSSQPANSSKPDAQQFAEAMNKASASHSHPQPGPTPDPQPGPPPPNPQPSPTPGHPQAGGGGKWTPVNEKTINALIKQALKDNHGDVSKAFAELRNQRDKPANYYNTNLAIAADYLRSRWDTQQYGPEVAWEMNQVYTTLKGIVGVPTEGPGPVSPDSSVEKKYMQRGITDQTNTMPVWEQAAAAADSQNELLLATADQIPGLRDVSHGFESASSKVGSFFSRLFG